MLAFARRHARDYHAFLCYKFDRAARNLSDYDKLEQLEERHNLLFLSITQPIENSPTGSTASDFVYGTISRTAPAGTARVSLSLFKSGLNIFSGSGTVIFDDAELTQIPEPASLLLLGIGVSALTLRRRAA